MKKYSLVLLIALLIMNTPIHALDIDIDEHIDPVSLDILIKQGLIDKEDREKYLTSNNKGLSAEESESGNDSNFKSDKEKGEELASKDILDVFAVASIKQIGQNAIMVTFNQKLSDNAYLKNNYTIKGDSSRTVFRHSDFTVRKVVSDDRSIVIKLDKKSFDRNKLYKLIASDSLSSFYRMKINNNLDDSNQFIITSDMTNEEVISYNAYSDGYIDISFKYEISDKMLNSKKYMNIKFNDDKFMHSAKSINLIEDDDGVARTMRVMFAKFQSKYDYTLKLKNLNLKNSEYRFPGGSSLSNYFNVEDINIIDNYTIDLTLDTRIDFKDDKELVRINNRVSLDNFEIYGDNHIILHLKKDGGMKFLSEYSIELVNFTSIDDRKLANISYLFTTEDYKVQKEYLDIKILKAEWIGEGYIKLSFNKAVDLKSNANAFIKIKDEDSKTVRFTESYQLDPQNIVLKTSKGKFGDAYKIIINNLPEKGGQFRSSEESITISN